MAKEETLPGTPSCPESPGKQREPAEVETEIGSKLGEMSTTVRTKMNTKSPRIQWDSKFIFGSGGVASVIP